MRNAAEVVANQPLRYWLYKSLVTDSMRKAHSPLPVKLSVSSGVSATSPFPATTGHGANPAPEASRQAGVAKLGRGGKLELHRTRTAIPQGGLSTRSSLPSAAPIS